ncbi:MAG: T9SS type A sorting domain-containing protein [Bacteroidia bacterium]
MKKITLFLIMLFGTEVIYSQPTIQWQKSYGGTVGDLAQSVQQTFDGGYIVAGITTSTNGDVSGNFGNDDFWVVKLSNTGAIQWQKCLGGTNADDGYSVQQTSDSGYVVAGVATSTNGNVTGNQGSDDFWIVKLSSSGNIQWQKTAGGTGADDALFVQQTSDGGYIITGDTQSNNGDVSGNHGSDDVWVVKLSSGGAIQWTKCFGGTSLDSGSSIQQTSDGGYILVGSTMSNNGDVSGNHGNYDAWLVKLNNAGTLQWQKCLGGTAEDIGYSVQQTVDTGYVITGFTMSNNGDVSGNHSAQPDYWVVKLSNSGIIQWQKCLGGTGDDKAYSIRQTADSGYVVTGYTKSIDGDVSGNHAVGFEDYWVVKLSGSGTIQWQKCLGGTNDDWARSIKQTADGGYVIAGWSKSNDGDVTGNHGNNDFWVVKLSPSVTGIKEPESNVNWQIFPNPSSGIFSVNSDMSTGNTILKIVNSVGQLILRTEIYTNHTSIDISQFTPGLYFAIITTGHQNWTKKIIIE